ncbi:unnamed protein product, partial [Medioppia subpectinata]
NEFNRFHEICVSILFALIVLLWFFREPGVFTGWADLINNKGTIKDATPAILIGISFFIIPSNLKQFYSETENKKMETLLDWKTVQTKMPWVYFFLTKTRYRNIQAANTQINIPGAAYANH